FFPRSPPARLGGVCARLGGVCARAAASSLGGGRSRVTKEIKARRRRRTKKKMPRARWREDGRPGASWPAASTPPWHGRPARIGAGQRPLPRAAWGRLGAEDEGEDQIGRG
ncbi:unnamed protein product, partial [Prorocentrum cordatum]